MSKIIEFPPGGGPPKSPAAPPDNLITERPLCLRWGDWRTTRIIQVQREAALPFEQKRAACIARGRDPAELAASHMPPHFALDDGAHETALALLRWRGQESAQIEVGYLACLMEALVHAPCPVLRTDLIRRDYQEVKSLSQKLATSWRGRAGRFMLPLAEDARQPDALARLVAPLNNLQDFFAALRGLAQKRHQTLAQGYVIYYPRQRSL